MQMNEQKKDEQKKEEPQKDKILTPRSFYVNVRTCGSMPRL